MSKISKRSFLSLGSGVLASSLSTGTWAQLQFSAQPPDLSVAGLVHDRKSAKRIAQEYLRLTPELNLADLRQSLQSRLSLDRSAQTQIAEMIRQDYRDHHTVTLNGWVLSKTEVELCVLMAVSV